MRLLRNDPLAMGTLVPKRKSHILRLARKRSDGESHAIAAILFDQFDRIDPVPLGFRHGLSKPILNLGMNANMFEGDIPHVVQTRQHHAGYPQRDDVA